MTRVAQLFVIAVAIHNLEEALRLPAWVAAQGWVLPVSPDAFAAATQWVTVLVVLSAWLAMRGTGRFFCGVVLAMMLNAVFPHLILSALTRSLAPGVVSSVLLVVPIGAMYLRRVAWRRDMFGWAFGFAILALAPLMFLVLKETYA